MKGGQKSDGTFLCQARYCITRSRFINTSIEVCVILTFLMTKPGATQKARRTCYAGTGAAATSVIAVAELTRGHQGDTAIREKFLDKSKYFPRGNAQEPWSLRCRKQPGHGIESGQYCINGRKHRMANTVGQEMIEHLESGLSFCPLVKASSNPKRFPLVEKCMKYQTRKRVMVAEAEMPSLPRSFSKFGIASPGRHAGTAVASAASREFRLQELTMLSLGPIVRGIQRWWFKRAEHHYLMCADVEQQRAREAQMNVAYYQKRAAMARSARLM